MRKKENLYGPLLTANLSRYVQTMEAGKSLTVRDFTSDFLKSVGIDASKIKKVEFRKFRGRVFRNLKLFEKTGELVFEKRFTETKMIYYLIKKVA